MPSPYKSNQSDVALLDRIAAHPLAVKARRRQEEEQLRLLYVAWTRARDRLVLAGPAAKMFEGHPHFTIFPGDSVEIMECLPLPAQ